MSSIYNFAYKTPAGNLQELSQYKGKVLLIVNTASRCGFTYQFEGLETLYKHYKDSGLEIISFPCNQFAHQEPLADEEVEDFCRLTYDVSFPVSQKIEVNGKKADPLFNYLKENSQMQLNIQDHLLSFMTSFKRDGYQDEKDIRWNFTKFLINKNGQVFARFEPRVKPSHLTNFIERLLQAG